MTGRWRPRARTRCSCQTRALDAGVARVRGFACAHRRRRGGRGWPGAPAVVRAEHPAGPVAVETPPLPVSSPLVRGARPSRDPRRPGGQSRGAPGVRKRARRRRGAEGTWKLPEQTARAAGAAESRAWGLPICLLTAVTPPRPAALISPTRRPSLGPGPGPGGGS